MLVSTTAVDIGGGSCLIQNLGPDKLYLGGPQVSTYDGEEEGSIGGLELKEGEAVSMVYINYTIWAISEGTSEVRILNGASGLFASNPPPLE